MEAGAAASGESPLRYQPDDALTLTCGREPGMGTVAGRQFDWGGRLRKGNGGAQRCPQGEWKPPKECKGRRALDCEAYEPSRAERRA